LITGYGLDVVTHATFQIDSGTIAAVVGTNGSGKTTLLRTLVGLLPALSGSITFAGQPVAQYRTARGIGYLPEALGLHPAWSVRGLLRMAAFAARVGDDQIAEAVELAGIDFDLDQPVVRLSKGMRQRCALAMTLIPVPELLLLDEPEAGLDPGQRIRLRDRIRELARGGRIIVIASHDISGVCSVADQTFLLTGGRMRLLSAAELADPARIVALFAEEVV
jgi:ABC-2 type transport system ATP-binding protein